MKPRRTKLCYSRVVWMVVLAWTAGAWGQEELKLSPVKDAPWFGTFYSIQRADWPPFPFNPFPELPVYGTEIKGVYWFDDRSVDYAALRKQAADSSSQGGGMMMMSGGDSPYSEPGLKLTIPVFTNGYIYTTIFEHDPTMGYDLYYLTNLNLTNWTAALGNLAGQTNYWLTNSFSTDLFLRVASGLDSDGDGMLDGWELLHGFNPHSAGDAAQDADGDGLTNLQEFQQGSDPKSAAAWAVFVATPRGTSALP